MRRLNLISATTWILFVLSAVKGQNRGCESLGTTNQTAYIGWPILFDLIDVVNHCYAIYDENSTLIRSTMRYIGSNESLYDTGSFDIYDNYPSLEYEIPNVSNDTPDVMMMVEVVNTSVCCTLRKNLTKEILKSETCKAAYANTTNVRDREHEEGDVAVFTCEVLEGSGSPKINTSQYKVTWYYQCNRSLPEDANIKDDGTLNLGKMNHSRHPGLYSCSIVHNGQIRFIQHQRTCIAPGLKSSQVSVKCEKSEYLVDIGDTAEATCTIDIAEGAVDDTNYVLIFYPLYKNKTQDESRDNVSCPAYLGATWTFAPDKRVSCIASAAGNLSHSKSKCFYDIPTESEWQKEIDKKITKLKMKYRIEKVKTDDFSHYWASAKHTGISGKDTDEFIISRKSHADETAVIVGCVLGGILILLLIILVCYCFRLEIRYHWRRSRCVHYAKTTDIKEFGAYLTYYWSNEEGKRVENPHYQTLIDRVTELLIKLNCPVYDPGYAPHQFQFDAENVKKVQPKCDRVIVILSDRYIEKKESDFDLYTNFLESTFVFIKVPNFDQAMENLDKKRRYALEAQLRRNYVIKWDGKRNLSEKFKMKLELAMLKRQEQKEIIAYENVFGTIKENSV